MKLTIHTHVDIKKIEEVALALVEEQLKAYNNRDIEAFLKPFSDNIKRFDYPNQLLFDGKEKMKTIYTQLFDTNPDLHCKTIFRTVFKDIVIDKELVTGMKIKDTNAIPYYLAIYQIESNKISEVRFMKYLSEHFE